MKARGAFLKLFLDNLLAMAVILALAGAFTYHRLNESYQLETRQNQDRLTRIATAHFQDLWPLPSGQADQLCKTLFNEPSMRLTVVAADGQVLGDSQANPQTMSNHRTSDRPELIAALEGRPGNHQRRSDTLGVQSRYVALPVVHNAQVVAAVRVAMPIKTIAEGESVVRNAVLWSALAGALAAVLLGLLTSWTWYAPLRRLTETAKQIAAGNLSSKTGIAGASRLGELSVALNDMRDHLGKTLSQIASQHQDFQTVLANLQEGVVATDAQGQIVLINQAAGRLFGAELDHCAGKPLQAVLPVLEVLEFHRQVLASPTPIKGQFEINTPRGRRTLEGHGVKVPPGPSTISCLLVLRDVTELAAATAMKTQFVANASHELRTPLATIRAAVDSLASADFADPEEVSKLTGMLDRHVARLEEMTKDLLDLHIVESAKMPLRLTPIALGDLAHWATSQFQTEAQDKSVTLSARTASPEHTIRTDRKLLELILRNLIDNAIKFTPAGGSVQCELAAVDQGVTVRVCDTGCGIRSDEQARVFERFYQSDAARTGDSRKRGTGLGLAIVKHAAERLGAKIELQSQLGQGTTVTLLLPHRSESAPSH